MHQKKIGYYMRSSSIFAILILAIFYHISAFSFEYNQNADVHVITKNTGSKNLKNVYTKFGSNTVGCGILFSGSQKTYISYPHPITREAKVNFELENNEHFEKVITLPENQNIRKSTDITVIITINTDKNIANISTHDGLVLN